MAVCSAGKDGHGSVTQAVIPLRNESLSSLNLFCLVFFFRPQGHPVKYKHFSCFVIVRYMIPINSQEISEINKKSYDKKFSQSKFDEITADQYRKC